MRLFISAATKGGWQGSGEPRAAICPEGVDELSPPSVHSNTGEKLFREGGYRLQMEEANWSI